MKQGLELSSGVDTRAQSQGHGAAPGPLSWPWSNQNQEDRGEFEALCVLPIGFPHGRAGVTSSPQV